MTSRRISIFLKKGCLNIPEGSIQLVAYFFARIAKDQPELIRLYEDQLSGVSGKGALVLLEVLRLAGDSRTREFLESCLADDAYSAIRDSITEVLETGCPQFQSAMLRPVRDCLDLDLLWAEFLATGSKEPIFRIIEVLNRPDVVRERIQGWLNDPGTAVQRWPGGSFGSFQRRSGCASTGHERE